MIFTDILGHDVNVTLSHIMVLVAPKALPERRTGRDMKVETLFFKLQRLVLNVTKLFWGI